jgi:hypothetical protein
MRHVLLGCVPTIDAQQRPTLVPSVEHGPIKNNNTKTDKKQRIIALLLYLSLLDWLKKKLRLQFSRQGQPLLYAVVKGVAMEDTMVI